MIRRIAIFLLALCVCIVLLAPVGDLRSAAAFIVLWVLPGLGWGLALGGRWVIGFGLGLSLNVLFSLMLHYLPGPVLPGLGILLFAASALLPFGLTIVCRSKPSSRVQKRVGLLVLISVAAFFRVTNLGYSEFQGDEGVIMVRAAAALEGDDEELFLHQKGPVEILVPMAQWLLGEAIDEFWARLPFAWFSLLGALATWQLGRRWFGHWAGAAGGFLLAINGFHVAFGRIVQYQSWVVLMGLVALLAFDYYRQGSRPQDLLLGSVFLSSGLLGHYDAVLFAPAAAALLLMAARRKWKWIIAAAVMGAAGLALFYLPYALNPNFGKTATYLAGDRIGGGLHFNAEKVWAMSTVYNSSYYVVGLGLLLIAGVWFSSIRTAYPAWLLFLVPFCFYLLVVSDPRTHLYTFYPGAALLVGAVLANIGRAARHRRWYVWLAAAGVGLYLLCAGYTWLLFVNHSPEYQRNFPSSQLPVYWTTYDQMPLYGRFGFPHQAGWRAFGEYLYANEFSGWYASNEEQEITDWYTRQAPRTHCPGPELYTIAENVQDEIGIDWGELENAYHLAGTVKVDGRETLRWYGEVELEPIELDAADYRPWRRPEEAAPPTDGGDYPVDVAFGEKVRLVGYDLDTSQAYPGGRLKVTLYWQPLVPLERNYQVFVHLYDGQMRGQHDGAPECAVNPTTRWEPGQVIPDPHEIVIDSTTPVAPVPLVTGMYDLITKDRLGVPGSGEGLFHLTKVELAETAP